MTENAPCAVFFFPTQQGSYFSTRKVCLSFKPVLLPVSTYLNIVRNGKQICKQVQIKYTNPPAPPSSSYIQNFKNGLNMNEMTLWSSWRFNFEMSKWLLGVAVLLKCHFLSVQSHTHRNNMLNTMLRTFSGPFCQFVLWRAAGGGVACGTTFPLLAEAFPGLNLTFAARLRDKTKSKQTKQNAVIYQNSFPLVIIVWDGCGGRRTQLVTAAGFSCWTAWRQPEHNEGLCSRHKNCLASGQTKIPEIPTPEKRDAPTVQRQI